MEFPTKINVQIVVDDVKHFTTNDLIFGITYLQHRSKSCVNYLNNSDQKKAHTFLTLTKIECLKRCRNSSPSSLKVFGACSLETICVSVDWTLLDFKLVVDKNLVRFFFGRWPMLHKCEENLNKFMLRLRTESSWVYLFNSSLALLLSGFHWNLRSVRR